MANSSFGIDAGVSVTGKFGPVQVSAAVNASHNTSQSSSTTSAQEYAKTVTEEATKRVKNTIKEVSSITILTERQDTSLQGFNNVDGTEHINGIYRWVDKLYDARLMNYGRRVLLSLNVPEPAAFHRSLLGSHESAALAELVEPIHPSRISRTNWQPLPASNTNGGFRSYQDLEDDNYARLAGLYDVSGLEAPPAGEVAGGTAIAYPEAMEARKIDVHDAVNDPGWVSTDNTLSVDAGYRVTHLGVFVTAGASGDIGSYVDALHLGEVAGPAKPSDGTTVAEANLVLVTVGDNSFYLSVRRDPDDPDGKIIKTNFNEWQLLHPSAAFTDKVAQVIPITITARFEGVLTLNVLYRGERTDAAYDAWQSRTWAAILKGYDARKKAYDQARTLAKAKAGEAVAEQTFQLRTDQYRQIELTELKRGCIDLLTEGTAVGHTSITIEDGTPRIVFDEAEGAQLDKWRHPLSNGAVTEFFEQVFEWPQSTYQFHPYYWAGLERWHETAQASGADPVFEQFLRAGSASVVVPVRPGYERPALMFLLTGLIWAGGYLPLLNTQEILDIYTDVELGRVIDPPEQVGEPWQVRVPTSLVILQDSGVLPQFPPAEAGEPGEPEEPGEEEPPVGPVPFWQDLEPEPDA